ncbi:MAG: hypothetical protein WB791_04690 [Waddliaceae bacterium]
MEALILRLLRHNWPRKLSALILAVAIWIVVNHSLTETKTISHVPIRVINLPANKTIEGLLPNGYLSQRATLTLSGSRSLINELEQGDLEVRIDASTAESDQWVMKMTKKNLVSLDPSLDLSHNINAVKHPEYVIKLSELVKGDVPVQVKRPIGEPPHDYLFLDVWPEHFTQSIEGPKEKIEQLKNRKLKLILDLNTISQAELDMVRETSKQGYDDVVHFEVPDQWKKVRTPFHQHPTVKIDDPEAKNLRISFLYKQTVPVKREIPLRVFYPLKFIQSINPDTQKILPSDHIRVENGMAILTEPLYVRNVSKRFLDIIRDNIEIIIIAAPKSERETLKWSIEVVDPKEMENTYVAITIAEQNESMDAEKREQVLRKRFREFLDNLQFYTANREKLQLISTLENEGIVVEVKG